ncbi:hypothetical protein [Mesorhizobium delmotii]|uniref:hypothetical protein n=1 Tax=Mesorhizobium delmotii TaxID=1631247 RepID=UPI000F43E394|nr:hypothetical protein [Mesorhizobium delmotii]
MSGFRQTISIAIASSPSPSRYAASRVTSAENASNGIRLTVAQPKSFQPPNPEIRIVVAEPYQAKRPLFSRRIRIRTGRKQQSAAFRQDTKHDEDQKVVCKRSRHLSI